VSVTPRLGPRPTQATVVPDVAPNRDSLELDIDLRTSQVWAEMEPALRSGEITLGVIASAVRAAYAQGYADCLKDQGVRLYADNGYDVPQPERR
jgi:hypothetical protein